MSAAGFSLLLAFFAVVSGVVSAATYLSDRNSDTTFWVIGADDHLIHLKVLNTGRKPSRLIGYRLKFIGERMIDDAPLRREDGDSVIASGNPFRIDVGLNELSPSLETGSKNRYTKNDIRKLLSEDHQTWWVRIEVDIEESGHVWSPVSRPFIVHRYDIVPAAELKNFILGGLPDVAAQ